MSAATIVAQQGISDEHKTIKFLTLGQKFLMLLSPCDHNWSFPQTSRDKDMKKAYAQNEPYDSHQQCPECGAMRLYDQKTMQGGPIFFKEEKQHG